MGWSAPRTYTAGEVHAASTLNTDHRDNILALRGGGLSIPSQAVDDFIFADTSTQFGRLAAATGEPFYNGTDWVIHRDIRTDLPIVANVLTIDLAQGALDRFRVTRNAIITTTTISNLPTTGRGASFLLEVIGDGNAYAWAWFTATVKWPNGIVPTLTTTIGKMDRFVFDTSDGGTTWFGSIAGQVYL